VSGSNYNNESQNNTYPIKSNTPHHVQRKNNKPRLSITLPDRRKTRKHK
jgi:hypothetical protein